MKKRDNEIWSVIWATLLSLIILSLPFFFGKDFTATLKAKLFVKTMLVLYLAVLYFFWLMWRNWEDPNYDKYRLFSILLSVVLSGSILFVVSQYRQDREEGITNNIIIGTTTGKTTIIQSGGSYNAQAESQRFLEDFYSLENASNEKRCERMGAKYEGKVEQNFVYKDGQIYPHETYTTKNGKKIIYWKPLGWK
jgi:asparagine N-glycosylation enzyme membrane subunit Stt3